MFLGEQERLYVLFERSWCLRVTAERVVLPRSEADCKPGSAEAVTGCSPAGSPRDRSQAARWASRARGPFPQQVWASRTGGKRHSAPEPKTTQTHPSERENKKTLLTSPAKVPLSSHLFCTWSLRGTWRRRRWKCTPADNSKAIKVSY